MPKCSVIDSRQTRGNSRPSRVSQERWSMRFSGLHPMEDSDVLGKRFSPSLHFILQKGMATNTLFSLVSTTNGQLSYSCLPGGQMGSAKVQVAKIRRGQCSLPHKHITAICDATASAAMTRLSDDESVVNVFSNATQSHRRSHSKARSTVQNIKPLIGSSHPTRTEFSTSL